MNGIERSNRPNFLALLAFWRLINSLAHTLNLAPCYYEVQRSNMRRTTMASARQKKQDLSLWILVCILVGGIVYAAYAVDDLFRENKRDRAREGLERIGLACKEYANRNEQNYWPPVSFDPTPLSLDSTLLNSATAKPADLISPALPNVNQYTGERSYYYLGYAIMDEAHGLALVNAFHDIDLSDIEPLAPIETSLGEISALREGIERLMVADELNRQQVSKSNTPNPRAAYSRMLNWILPVAHAHSYAKGPSEMPALIEDPGLFGNGGHVLYLDGHVEFVPYPGKFPMTRNFIAALESMKDYSR